MTDNIVDKLGLERQYEELPADTFDVRNMGRRFNMEFCKALLIPGGVLEPAVVTNFNGEYFLIDGRNRFLHSQYLSSQEENALIFAGYDCGPGDFAFVPCIIYRDVDPDDRSIWSIILNEARSENIIHVYRRLKEFERSGQLDEYEKEAAIYKNSWNKFKQLNKLKDIEKWVERFDRGEVAEKTLFAISKLNPVQQTALLNQKEKVTGTSVHDVRTAIRSKALAGLMGIMAPAPKQEFFIVWEGNNLSGPYPENPGGNNVYRLIKVINNE